MSLLLTIVHLTDLHVDGRDADGLLTEGSVAQQRMAVAWVGRAENPRFSVPLPARLQEHVSGFSHEAWGALEDSLPNLVGSLLRDEEQPDVVVVQTGDFSMFGATGAGNSAESAYPAWGALRVLHEDVTSSIDADQKRRFGWIDLYGNHDIWPGTVPRRPPWTGGRRGPIETIPDVSTGVGWAGQSVIMLPINTVRATWFAGDVFASGKVGPWITGGPKYAELGAIDGNRVRVVLTHHALISVSPLRGLWAGWTWPSSTGWVGGAPAALEELRRFRTEILLAGHLHELHPVEGLGDPFSPDDQMMPQQFVAPSPAKSSPSHPVPSFCVYKIYEEDSEYCLTRELHSFRDDIGAGPHFAPGREQVMLPAWSHDQ